MKSLWREALRGALLAQCALLILACRTVTTTGKSPEDPGRFAKEISQMLERDAKRPPEKGGILFVGSSSIKNWWSVYRDMDPLPVANRGFGGSKTHDQLHYMNRIVLPLGPKVIVYYCGDNDLANPHTPAGVAVANFQEFCERVWAKNPQCRILYMSIKPSPAREKYWPKMRSANRQIALWCALAPRVEFIDLTDTLLAGTHEYQMQRFGEDGLHLNMSGYAAWRNKIRPRVERAWRKVN